MFGCRLLIFVTNLILTSVNDSMECRVSICPYEGHEDDDFVEMPRIKIESKPPDGTTHNQHPAFDQEVQRDVRQAFEEAVPIGEQLRFLNNYDYPYQYPTVVKVEWYPERSISDLVDKMEFTEKFESNL